MGPGWVLALSLARVGGGGAGGLARAGRGVVVGEVWVCVELDVVVVGELRKLGLVEGVGRGGRGRGREGAERGDGVGHVGDVGDDGLDGAEDACDDEQLIEPCPKREKRQLDRASPAT